MRRLPMQSKTAPEGAVFIRLPGSTDQQPVVTDAAITGAAPAAVGAV